MAALIQRALGEEGHQVRLAVDLAEARALAATGDDELLLVDRNLPDGDGLDLVRGLRRGGDRRPALCLSARDRVEERVAGLSGGADDYLVKPFAISELLARLAALARRAGLGAGRVEIGDLVVDLDALRVWRGGQEISVTPQEFRVLRALVEHQGKVVTRSRLLELAWDTLHDPGTNLVDVYIRYLRGKIDKDHPEPLIHTVRGHGYLLERRG